MTVGVMVFSIIFFEIRIKDLPHVLFSQPFGHGGIQTKA